MSKDIPQGMQIVDVPETEQDQLQLLKPEQLSNGTILVFHGRRRLGSGDRAFDVYLVSSAKYEGRGKRVGLRITARLEQLLAGVSDGEHCYVRYDGKEPLPGDSSKFRHQWTVARDPAKAESAEQSVATLEQFE